MSKVPKLSDKKYGDLIKEFKDIASEFVPEWNFDETQNDFGVSLAKIFCEMQEDTISKLNKSVNNIYSIFLNLIGVSPLPKQPAQGLITIEASKNSSVFCVKKGSKLSANNDITFETLEDIFVMDNKIRSIFMTDYHNKRISKVFDENVEESKFKQFKIFDFENFPNLQSRALYLSDNHIFSGENLDLNFKFENCISSKKENDLCDIFFESKWQYYDKKSKKWKDSVEKTKNDDFFINVKFDHKAEFSNVMGKESRYLRVLLSDYNSVDLTGISYSANSKSFIPEEIFSGEDKITEPEFIPFKERYYIYDCFYIKCDKVFIHYGSNIEINAEINFTKVKSESGTSVKNYKMIMSDIDFAESEPSDIKILSVNWEYWNGTAWDLLKANDNFFSTENKEKKRKVEFICPKNFSATTIGLKNGLFIRCKITKMSNQFSPFANYIVPYLKDLKLSFFYKIPNKLKNVIVNSNLEWKNLYFSNQENKLVSLFEKEEQESPSLYIRLKNPISEGIFNIFFDITEGSQKEKISFKWQYLTKDFDDYVWKTLDIIDFTDNFSKSGIVKILGEKNFCESKLFGEKGFFIRIISLNDIEKYKHFPIINDIKLNVVDVIQKDSKPYEYFYINDNEKNKICSLSSKNMFEIEVWVDETSKISVEEQKIIKNKNPNDIEIKLDSLGSVEKVWVKWKKMLTLLNAGPNDRCYEVNFNLSQIKFGDGINGKIPPAQFNESIKIKYSTTEGIKGNIKPHSLKNFDSVFHSVVGIDNSKPMYNGLDDEDIHHAAMRFFDEICSGRRIVSSVGLEKAILFNNRNVHKVKCFPNVDKYGKESFGDLTIVILPREIKQDNFNSIKSELESFLNKNVPFNFSKGGQIVVTEVKYVEFYLKFVIRIKNFDCYQEVHSSIISKINEFINPITGNQNKKGFEIGEIPNERDIINSISYISGISRIENVSVSVRVQDDNGEKKEVLLNDAMKIKFAVPILKDIDMEIHI